MALQTGAVTLWTADTGIDGQTPVDLEELDLICIDPLPSWVWYQDMADFAEAIMMNEPAAGCCGLSREGTPSAVQARAASPARPFKPA